MTSERIKEIQEAFEGNGISMLMSSDKQNKVSVHVILKKVFCLQKMTDELFLDAHEANHAYFEIPKSLSFDQFAVLTQKVRYNWLESKFDAALGYYMR